MTVEFSIILEAHTANMNVNMIFLKVAHYSNSIPPPPPPPPLDSFPPSAAYMRRWTGSALVQIMACRVDAVMTLSQPMLTYCQLDHKEYISMKFYLEFEYFNLRKCIYICRLRNGCNLSRGDMSFIVRKLIGVYIYIYIYIYFFLSMNVHSIVNRWILSNRPVMRKACPCHEVIM